MNIILFFFLFLCFPFVMNVKEWINLLEETFESQQLPEGWNTFHREPGEGWRIGTPNNLSGIQWQIPNPHSFHLNLIAVSNDDLCIYCDSSQDFLDSPPIYVPKDYDDIILEFDTFYNGEFFHSASLLISTNTTGFESLYVIEPKPFWNTVTLSLRNYFDQTVVIRFWSNDNGGWGSGFAIDNVHIYAHQLTGVVPNCAQLLWPPDREIVPFTPFNLEWTSESYSSNHLRFLINFGLYLNNSFEIESLKNLDSTYSYTTPIKQADSTYYWQIIPYNVDGTQAQNCPIWTFITSSTKNLYTLPYFENFESGEGNWIPLGDSSSWGFGTPQKTTIKEAASGINAWVTGGLGEGEYNLDERSYLVSPIFNFSSVQSLAFIKMKIWYETKFVDGAVLQYSMNLGETWITIGTHLDPNWYTSDTILSYPGNQSKGWTGRIDEWTTIVHHLENLQNKDSVIFRIAFASSNANFQKEDGFAVDDIVIFEGPTTPPPCAVLQFPQDEAQDLSYHSLSLMWEMIEDIPLTAGFLLNFGTNFPPSNIFSLRNVGMVNSVSTGFKQTDTKYYWQVIPYDHNNNTAVNCPVWSFSTHLPKNFFFPYFEDFENGTSDWIVGGTHSSWSFGKPMKNVIQGTSSGSNAWVTGGLGLSQYNANEYSWVMSPFFNFSEFENDPILQMKIWYDIETEFDGARVEYSIDAGDSWIVVGDFNEKINWYNSRSIRVFPEKSQQGWTGTMKFNTYITSQHILDNLAGQNSVLLRILFKTDNNINRDGFAFDDVSIFEAPKEIVPSCAALVYPPNQASGFPTVEFDLKWEKNESVLGLPYGSLIKFGFSLENLQNQTAQDLGFVFQFTTPLKKYLTTYYWQVIPYGMDGIQAEDCPIWSFKTEQIPVVMQYPYFEDFEKDVGGWIAVGTSSSWSYGVLQKQNIVDSTKAWVTGGLGHNSYNHLERSWVLSPVFNFSLFAEDPTLCLYIWRDLEEEYDGAAIELSQNLGQTWQLVGKFGDEHNWYNHPHIPYLKNDGWTGVGNYWERVCHKLPNIVGEEEVFIRFLFASDENNVLHHYDGIAFDNISITGELIGSKRKMNGLNIENLQGNSIDETIRVIFILNLIIGIIILITGAVSFLFSLYHPHFNPK